MKRGAVVNAITYILLRFNLQNFRVKTWDGARNSMGKMSGVATRLLAESRKVLAIHYHGNSFSLAIEERAECYKRFEWLFEHSKGNCLEKNSPKQEKDLARIKSKKNWRKFWSWHRQVFGARKIGPNSLGCVFLSSKRSSKTRCFCGMST